jgi:uncharacterized membrane protein
MIPCFAVIQVENPYWHHRLRIWLPIFLVWFLLLPLAPLLLLIMAAICLVGGVNPLRAIAAFWRILCALPGTQVQVRRGANHVHARIL